MIFRKNYVKRLMAFTNTTIELCQAEGRSPPDSDEITNSGASPQYNRICKKEIYIYESHRNCKKYRQH